MKTALDAIDKLHTTAESHDRVIVMEVMGRHAGFIALHAGLAGTADVILIPEIPYDIEEVCDKMRRPRPVGTSLLDRRRGRGRVSRRRREAVLGARIRGGAAGGRRGRPAGAKIRNRTGKEARSMVLGHLQRGGQPTGYDRLLATRFGGAAVVAVANEKWGHMVALQSPHIVTIPIAEALREPKRVGSTTT